jgi:hypothetical protein
MHDKIGHFYMSPEGDQGVVFCLMQNTSYEVWELYMKLNKDSWLSICVPVQATPANTGLMNHP